ncbi:nascent polypeptide-associated complex subunit alpha, muscle-specific form-like [Bacillus rossius redtenbacheri]|uniref:nascent polypeptide-associated complex subunit alpha, muscle-specific form-like n=1 Tax=Bacillus rossius redtenbacheri TaxID=93214 RepID=UPI002FDE5B60
MSGSGVSWIYRLHRDELIRYLEENQLSVSASDTVADMRARLVQFIREVDASHNALGAVLGHLEEGQIRPIAYASRSLSESEQRLGVYEKEALACLFGLEKFESYLDAREFDLYTDNRALSWLFNHPHQLEEQRQRDHPEGRVIARTDPQPTFTFTPTPPLLTSSEHPSPCTTPTPHHILGLSAMCGCPGSLGRRFACPSALPLLHHNDIRRASRRLCMYTTGHSITKARPDDTRTVKCNVSNAYHPDTDARHPDAAIMLPPPPVPEPPVSAPLVGLTPPYTSPNTPSPAKPRFVDLMPLIPTVMTLDPPRPTERRTTPTVPPQSATPSGTRLVSETPPDAGMTLPLHLTTVMMPRRSIPTQPASFQSRDLSRAPPDSTPTCRATLSPPPGLDVVPPSSLPPECAVTNGMLYDAMSSALMPRRLSEAPPPVLAPRCPPGFEAQSVHPARTRPACTPVSTGTMPPRIGQPATAAAEEARTPASTGAMRPPLGQPPPQVPRRCPSASLQQQPPRKRALRPPQAPRRRPTASIPQQPPRRHESDIHRRHDTAPWPACHRSHRGGAQSGLHRRHDTAPRPGCNRSRRGGAHSGPQMRRVNTALHAIVVAPPPRIIRAAEGTKPPPPTAEDAPLPPATEGAPLPLETEGAPLPTATECAPLLPTMEGAPLLPATEVAPLPPAMKGAPLLLETEGAPLLPATEGAPLPLETEGAPLPPATECAPLSPAMEGAPQPPATEGAPLLLATEGALLSPAIEGAPLPPSTCTAEGPMPPPTATRAILGVRLRQYLTRHIAASHASCPRSVRGDFLQPRSQPGREGLQPRAASLLSRFSLGARTFL